MVLEIIIVHQIVHISLQLILLLAVHMDDTACADVPQPHSSIAATRVQNGLVFTHPDRLDHARVPARLKKVLNLRRSHINHVKRVVRVRGKAELAGNAARERRRARVLTSEVHRVAHLHLVLLAVVAICCSIYVTSLVEVLILLHEFLRVQIPQTNFAIV